MITFDINWILVLQFVVATVLPLLVGIVTTKVTAPNIKAIVLAGLALISGVLTEILNALISQTPYDLGAGLASFVTIFIVSIAMHFGVWSRPGADGAPSISQRVQENVGNIDNGH